jgi:PRTRC genetic system ThiF family protein
MSESQRVLVPVTVSIDFGDDRVSIDPLEGNIVKNYTGFGSSLSNITINNRNFSGAYQHSAMLELDIPRNLGAAAMSLPDIRSHVSTAKNVELIVYTIIGAGGTGGYVIRDLLRFLQALKLKGDTRHFAVNIVDGDIVEEKNLIRQNFIACDLQKYKAEVLAKRYGAAFGVPVYYYNRFLETPEMLSNYCTDAAEAMNVRNHRDTVQHIIIGCVDNHQARRLIQRHTQNRDGIYWIDSGNERTSGQVVCSYSRFMRNIGGVNPAYFEEGGYPSGRANPMPTIVDIFPDILDSTKDLEGSDNTSCADRAAIEDQNIFINMTAAINVLNYLRQITNAEAITSNAVYFDIRGLSTVELLTPGYLLKIAGG